MVSRHVRCRASSSASRSRLRSKRLEKTQPSLYPWRLLNLLTWSMMPSRLIFARTVSSVRGLMPCLSARCSRLGRNWPSAHLRSTKMAKKVRWWFLLLGNSAMDNSSSPSMRAILLWLRSTFVLGVILFNLRTAYSWQIRSFSMGGVLMPLLKTRVHEKCLGQPTCLPLKTARFREHGAQAGAFLTGTGQKHSFYMVSTNWRFGRIRRVNHITFQSLLFRLIFRSLLVVADGFRPFAWLSYIGRHALWQWLSHGA